jgi:hypothetical protein
MEDAQLLVSKVMAESDSDSDDNDEGSSSHMDLRHLCCTVPDPFDEMVVKDLTGDTLERFLHREATEVRKRREPTTI